MANDNPRGFIILFHEICCRDEVGDIGGKVGIGKLSFTLAQAGKVKTQYGNFFPVECGSYVDSSLGAFGAGETMRKQRVGEGFFILGKIQSCRERFLAAVLKGYPFGLHLVSPFYFGNDQS